MDGFLGVDIGTTNSKAVLVGEDGDILEVWKAMTPQFTINGRCYFDMDLIETFADTCTEKAKSQCHLRSISFSSVGESVIPIKDGTKLAMPLVWHEKTNEITARQQQIINQYGRFEYTGVHGGTTYSIFKILWMSEHGLQEKPDMWLPISSYLIYRKTGIARWDSSQAGRSYVYNIHQQKWNVSELDELGVKLPEAIGQIGDFCGSKEDIVYGLGGHDHYMGLYAIRKLYGESNLFYDSMGSSSVLALIMPDKARKLRGKATYNPLGGCLVTGFEGDEYIVSRALDYYGRILDCFVSVSGKKTESSLFDSINRQLVELPEIKRLCRIMCPMDYGKYSNEAEGINLSEVKEGITLPELILSGYLYMVLGTKRLYEDLTRFCENTQNEMPYFTGGGIIRNELFMQLKAAALGREMKVLELSEISGLGAAISGMCASKEDKALKQMKEKLLKGNIYYPQKKYEAYIMEMKKRYGAD